jgi:hypothetical protein
LPLFAEYAILQKAVNRRPHPLTPSPFRRGGGNLFKEGSALINTRFRDDSYKIKKRFLGRSPSESSAGDPHSEARRTGNNEIDRRGGIITREMVQRELSPKILR